MTTNLNSIGAAAGSSHFVPQQAVSQAHLIASPLSAFGRVWNLPSDQALSAHDHLLDLVDGSSVLAKLLTKRGLGDREKARAFLQPETYLPTNPLELPDVEKAIRRISDAIAKSQHITVYGDYDVDGVTGTSVLLTVLRKLGASVDFYIPNRATEGYGLNLKAVTVLASKHRTKLIISCDCGVSNFAEVNIAKSLGVDTLVLDHHSMPQMLPPAVGIVHPKLLAPDHPLFELPGVGVAYKVCEALLLERGMPEEIEPLLDFVTLGMIADLVPLVKENRYLVQIGLPKLLATTRPGLRALLKQVHKSEDTDIVGFGLAPRINAVGRLSEAKAAVELMTTDDLDTAETLARQLQTENIKRQELCDQIFLEADRRVQNKKLDVGGAIAIYDPAWHHGVVGIVASRLVEVYNKPVFIGELDESEGLIRGSARGVDGMDLYQALKTNEALLTRWGGHKMAAGFTLEAAKGDLFCTAIASTCARLLANAPTNPVMQIELSLQAQEVTQDLARKIIVLAPFGMANKKPLLHVTNLRCLETRVLGREGKHHRITAREKESDIYFEAVIWNSRNRVPAPDQEIEIVFTPEINSFNGRERLQLVLLDWRPLNDSLNSNLNGSFKGSDCNSNDLEGASVDIAKESDVVGSRELNFAPGTPEGKSSKPQAEFTETPASTSAGSIAIGHGDKPPLAGSIAGLPLAAPADSVLPAQSERIVQIKDLRTFSQTPDVVAKARQKLGASLQVFAEPTGAGKDVKDRTMLAKSTHLMFLTLPPSQKVLQEIMAGVAPAVVYVVGQGSDGEEDAAAFLKRLYGLVKYAVNQKEGQVEGEKLAALMASTKMSLALGLTVLRKCHIIDWFAEDGVLFLDMLGEPISNGEELPEFKQLAVALSQTAEFRKWCRSAETAELEHAFSAAG